MIDIERIAHVCHEANRALQLTGGEDPSPHFFDAPEWQVQSAYEGVSAAIEGSTPEKLHESKTSSAGARPSCPVTPMCYLKSRTEKHNDHI